MNGAGIQRGSELWFYASTIAYKVYLYDYKYFVTRVSKQLNPCVPVEWIPLLESGSIAEVLAILNQEPFFLTADQVPVQWSDNELCNVSAG